MPRKVVLVADPGIDTAFAVALALNDPNLEVVGLLPTAGNVPAEQATATGGVAVLHLALQEVGDRLEPAVRVRRKALEVVVGIVRGKFIEHEKRVEPRELAGAEAATQLDARAVGGGQGFNDALDGALGHGGLQMVSVSLAV